MSRFRAWWWLSGVVAGFLGLAVSHLVAGILKFRESPVILVAEAVVALTPDLVVEWGLDTFDVHSRTALIVGLLLVAAVAFAWVGQQARRRWWLAVLGLCLVAALSGVAQLVGPGPAAVEWVPAAAGLATAVLALAVLTEWLRRLELVGAAIDATENDPTHTRRGFLATLGVMAAASGLGVILGNYAAAGRRAAEISRDLVRLDGVTKPLMPPGVSLGIEGATPWRTHVPDFFRYDTALVKPTIEAGEWQLRIHGMVERELLLTFGDLVAREITQDWITLHCVANPVGGPLVGNAWWSGYRLAGLLAEAGPLNGADAVLQTSHDGWTCSTPLAALVDDRNAMLAVAMNGEALQIEHGFPVRTLVPGLYGYTSACKWVVDLEVTRFADVTAYWTEKGMAETARVKTSSRIDVPAAGDDLPTGTTVCGGVAWSERSGVSVVEVSLDSGPWRSAELGQVPNLDTWVQWRATIELTAGDHQLRVRAVDGEGMVQTGVVSGTQPDGATGWHTVEFSAHVD